MSDPYLGEIRMFAGNFAPDLWTFCDGQTLYIDQNQALFSLIQTTYGGDGVTTFKLPDLRGRVPIHRGKGPGLSDRPIGSNGGEETVTLTPDELAAHSHPLMATGVLGTAPNPEGQVLAQTRNVDLYYDDTPAVAMATSSVTSEGSSQPQAHDNIMPFQCVSFIISLAGLYPPRATDESGR